MIKNLVLLVVLSWVSFSYAKTPQHAAIAHENLTEAESFKVEKSVPEHSATRTVAGSKIKREKSEVKGDGATSREPSESDSEVRYWKYSEE